MSIGVFGDSFACSWTRNSYDDLWVGKIESMLKENTTTYASPGTALWWSYELFLQHYKKYNKIVFAYTHWGRWNALPNHLKELATASPFPPHDIAMFSNQQKYLDLMLQVYPFMYSGEFQFFIFQSIFNSVNKLCKKENIELINLLSFIGNDKNQPMLDLSEASGSCLTNLVKISIDEFPKNHGKISSDARAGHLNVHNNTVLAKIIIETFADVNIHTKNLSEDPRFIKYNEN